MRLPVSCIFIFSVLFISFLVIIGWFTGIKPLVQIHPDFAPMQFNTAVCFLLISLSLIANIRLYRKIAITLALTCFFLAGLTGIQYLVGFSLMIDELFTLSDITVRTSHPGRMSPITAICFVASSLFTILHSISFKVPGSRHIKTMLLLPVVYFSLTALFRYLIGESTPYAWQIYTQMAAHTSLNFFLLCCFIFVSRLKNYTETEQVQIKQSVFLSVATYLIFVIFSTNLNNSERTTSQSIFLNEVNSIQSEGIISLKLQVNSLERMANRVGAGLYPSQEAFTNDALQYINQFGNIQAIEWVSSNNIIQWIVPLQGNEAVIGKDLNQESKRNFALQTALKTSKPRFSPVIDLLQGGKGCLLFVPILQKNKTPLGYLVTVYKLDPLVASLLGSGLEKFQIELYQHKRLISEFNKKIEISSTDYKLARIDNFGLNWQFSFRRLPLYQSKTNSHYPELILLLGTLVSIFLGNIIYLNRKISFKNIEIKKAAKIKSEFLANMSHEIRTPLNGVIGLTQLLEESVENQENNNKMRLLKRSADSLLSLVNDILDLSKLENGKIDLEKRPFNLTELSEEVIYLFSTIAKEKGIRLELSQEGNLTPNLYADENRIKQILANLVSNAIKFTEEGEVKLIISQGSLSDKGERITYFEVKDSGIGIDPKYHERIFDKFTQADSSVNRRYGGTGLGLSICRSLAHAMDGNIMLQSPEEGGSSFTLSLPLKTDSSHNVKGLDHNLDGKPNLSTNSIRILTAEDNKINQVVIEGMIKKAGYTTDLVGNGIEVLEALKTKKYDLILMDCQMPEMDGYTATKMVAEAYGENRPKIIAVTASTNEEHIKRCFEAGMDDTLAKPINFQQLCNKLEELFTTKKAS